MYGTDHQRHRRSAPGSRASSDRNHDDMWDRNFHFTTAIVCRVSNSLAEHTSFDRRGSDVVDAEKCRTELERLVDVLRHGAGLDVVELPSDEQQPDGLFVGDIAVVIGGVALICNPPDYEGRPSRHGEVCDSLG
jgi:dimethylargininase